MRHYLDHNATTPMRPEIIAAVAACLGAAGNASSVHAEGRAARAKIESARARVAALVGAKPADVAFTSGGTESAATLLAPTRAGMALILGAGEHPCVLSGGRFAPADIRPVALLDSGVLDLDALETALKAHPGAMVAVQHANNETGVIQPIAAIADLVHAQAGVLVVDAVQSAGKLKVDLSALGADALFVSAHKFGGPQGIGVIALAGARLAFAPLLAGGGQERGRRSGTENVVGIHGAGLAAEAALHHLDEAGSRAGLRDAFEAELKARFSRAVIFGDGAARLPNTSCFAVPGLAAETMLINFDLDGLAVSSGSACSSGKVRRSHVLAAMGVSESLAAGAIRVSFGPGNGPDAVSALLASLEKQAGRVGILSQRAVAA